MAWSPWGQGLLLMWDRQRPPIAPAGQNGYVDDGGVLGHNEGTCLPVRNTARRGQAVGRHKEHRQ